MGDTTKPKRLLNATRTDRGKSQTIFRSAARHKPYAQLGNKMLRDSCVSFAARGLLAFVLTYPTDWLFGPAWVCKEQKIGRDQFYSLINELLKAGYCIRRRERRLDGTLGPVEYLFSDEPEMIGGKPANSPLPEKPDVAEPEVAEPDVAEPDLANPITTKTDSNEDRRDEGEDQEERTPYGSDRGADDAASATKQQRASLGAWRLK
jgi:hypothetical protein